MRPHYHYAPTVNWLSDPNGLVWHDGKWHLFYQYNPHGEQWGHMAWGHATSVDLTQWQECPPALLEDDAHMIFSGSAVIDRRNSAGFGAGAMVAIYTGAAHPPLRHQSQCLAVSTDGGSVWRKYDGNPVLDRAMADFRDPNVLWHEATSQWIMVVALSQDDAALIYGSANLVDWTELSTIPTYGAQGHLWECPTLIELPVAGSDRSRWLFKVDVLSGAGGSGAMALVGDFDGITFSPDRDDDDTPRWISIDDGRDFYAAIPWHEPRDRDGRPCWIGWMGNHAYQAALPARGWRGAMSLPRHLSLRRQDGQWQLVQQVIPAIDALFEAADAVDVTALERRIAIASRLCIIGDDDWAMSLSDSHGASIRLVRTANTLVIQRAGGFHEAFDAPIHLQNLGDHPIRLWLDATTLEIEMNDGTRWVGLQHCLVSPMVDCSMTASGQLSLRCSTMRDLALAA